MKANKYQQELLDELTGMLLPYNHVHAESLLPDHVLRRMAQLNGYLKPEGLRLVIRHYNDGVGCGWIIHFAAL